MTSEITFRAIKAKHGDCFLIFAGETKILVDGGPSGVYASALRDQLSDLDSNDGVPVIDLMMVSHIDDDHINGILKLTDEMHEADQSQQDRIVDIDEAWYNSFSDMVSTEDGEDETKKIEASDLGTKMFSNLEGSTQGESAKMVLSSVRQGRSLRLNLEALAVNVNKGFKDKIVVADGRSSLWSTADVEIHVVGPNKAQVDDLKEKWVDSLVIILGNTETAAVEASKKMDKSISNLSSIVAIVKSASKSILLTGDARGDFILAELENSNWPQTNGVFNFDILKLPHHGSDRNLDDTFFRRVQAKHYVVSGDGGHGNPEPRMFDMLFNARPELDYKIYLTYSPDELKSDSKYISTGNVERFDEVFHSSERLNTLKWPESDNMYLDVEL